MSGKRFIVGSSRRQRGLWAAAGTTLGLCLVVAAPALLTGCGGSKGSITSPGNGGNISVGLGRAAPLIGSYKATKTLAGGQTQETTLEFTPGTAFETLSGVYTRHVLSPRPGGGNNYVSFESGILTGNILANGHLHLLLTADGDTKSRAAGMISRLIPLPDPGDAELELALGGGLVGGTLSSDAAQLFFIRLSPPIVGQTYQANHVAGTWSGAPSGRGGFQLNDPRTDMPFTTPPIDALTGISIAFDPHTDSTGLTYNAAVTLTDPATGSRYTAGGARAYLYSEYNSNNLQTVSGVTKLEAGEFFVVGRGHLPADAPALKIPNIGISIPFAGRAFLFEAGVGTVDGTRVQLGTLFLKFDNTDIVFPFLPGALGANPPTSIYVPVGSFAIVEGATLPQATSPTPTPTPTPTGTLGTGQVDIGTVQFSNASGSNVNTSTITNATMSAFSDSLGFTAEMDDPTVASTDERKVQIELGDYSNLVVGDSYPIVASATSQDGSVRVLYTENDAQGHVKVWYADGGKVVVTARSGNTITLSFVGATMNAPPPSQYANFSTGTFTLDAAGKFTP